MNFAIVKRHDFQQWHVCCPIHSYVTADGRHRSCAKAIGIRGHASEDIVLRKLRFWILKGLGQGSAGGCWFKPYDEVLEVGSLSMFCF